jgi:hypothetical protein
MVDVPAPLPVNGLRRWLQAQQRAVAAGREVSNAELQREMRSLAAEARRQDVPVERVLVLLKQEWRAAEASRPLEWEPQREHTAAERRADLLPRVVHTLIEEFYGA